MTYTFTSEYEIFGEPIELTIEYNFHKGYAASGPTFYSGGEPGEPNRAEVSKVTCRRMVYETKLIEVAGQKRTAKTAIYTKDEPFEVTGPFFSIIMSSEEIEDDILRDHGSF